MLIGNLFDFYSQLKKEGIIYCFCGPFSQSVMEGVGATLRLKLDLEDMDLNISQKVFAIFVEQVQNIINYSAERIPPQGVDDCEISLGAFIVGQEDKNFYLLCGNMVKNEDVPGLKDRLGQLRGLDREQLKALYRERRKMDPAKGSKGAGLGFIDMARKAGKPLDYVFTPLDGELTFFSLKVHI